jgi:hypothetical protein
MMVVRLSEGRPMTVEKDSSDRLPSESKEKAASKLGNGELHYVSAVDSNVVYQSTSWMLAVKGIFPSIILSLPPFVLVWLSGGARNPSGIKIWGGMSLVLLLVWQLPRLSQCFRTVDYYGLSFSTIKRRVKSQRQRHPWFLYRDARVILAFAVIVAATASSYLLSVVLVEHPLVGFPGMLIVFASFIPGVYAMRRFARSADDVRKRSGAPPVVLLRSFTDESLSWGSYGDRQPFERAVSRVLSRFGPFVAIGKPGERVPPFGAARNYINDQTWQVQALELIRSSRLLVMLAGSTKGLKWEFERIIDEGYHSKLLILIPPVSNAERHDRLRDLANALVNTMWHDGLSRAVGNDVISVQLGNHGVVIVVTAPGYRHDRLFFRDAFYLGLYGLLKDRDETHFSPSASKQDCDNPSK